MHLPFFILALLFASNLSRERGTVYCAVDEGTASVRCYSSSFRIWLGSLWPDLESRVLRLAAGLPLLLIY